MKKNIFFAVALIGLTVVCTASLLAAPKILRDLAENSAKKNQLHRARGFASNLLRFFPASESARDLLLQTLPAATDGAGGFQELLLIGADWSSYSSSRNGLRLDDASIMALVPRVADAQRMEMWRYHILARLAFFYQNRGEYGEAERYYLEASGGFKQLGNVFHAASIMLQLADLAEANGDVVAADRYLSELGGMAGLGASLQAEALLRQSKRLMSNGDKAAAASLLIEAKRVLWKEQGSSAEIQPQFLQAAKQLELIEAREQGFAFAACSGSFSRDGIAVPHIKVFLNPVRYEDGSHVHSGSMSYAYTATTDSSGTFRFDTVLPGSYDLIFGFSIEQAGYFGDFELPEIVELAPGQAAEYHIMASERISISQPQGLVELPYGSELKLSWDPVPEAYEYLISCRIPSGSSDDPWSSSISFGLDRTTDSAWSVRTDNRIGSGTTQRYPEDPIIVLGVFYPGAEFVLGISALREDGAIISDSEGFIFRPEANYPLWRIQPPDESADDTVVLLEGDSLFLQGRLEEAVAAYRQDSENGGARGRLANTALEYLRGIPVGIDWQAIDQ